MKVSLEVLKEEYQAKIASVSSKDEKSNKVFLAISILLLAFYSAIFSSATDKIAFISLYHQIIYASFFFFLFIHFILTLCFYISFFNSIAFIESVRVKCMKSVIEICCEKNSSDIDFFATVIGLFTRANSTLDEVIAKKNTRVNHLFCMAKHLFTMTLFTLMFLFIIKVFGLAMGTDDRNSSGDKVVDQSSNQVGSTPAPTPTPTPTPRVNPFADLDSTLANLENQPCMEGLKVDNGDKSILNG